MSKPTTAIFPIENGKLITTLDCNGLQLLNLDTDNLDISGPGGGNDTGTTTAILKGDGNHGFANAVPDTDYASVASVSSKEDSTAHDADITAVQSDITTLQTDVALKANAAAVTDALALKADAADLTAYISSNNTAVALKANSSDVTTALSAKADASATTTALAGKEPTLPTTANDSWILARHNAGSGSSWFFVDPVTLGTTNQSFVDGQSFTNTNFDSATAQFNSGDVGKTITGTNIPASTTISSITSATRVVLSQATTGTGGPGLSFTIFNRLTVAGGGGTVTSVSVNNDVANALFATGVSNPTTSATIGITMSTTVAANTVWGNPNAFPAAATFMTQAQQRTSLGATTSGSSILQIPNPNPAAGNVPVWIRLLADNTAQTRTASQTISDLGAENALTFSNPLARNINAISIPAATDSVAGHLTAADHTSFAAKVPGTRIITATAPLLIDGTTSANLTADRTISMPAATTGVSGYLTSSDFTTFTAKPPNSRTIAVSAPLSISGQGAPGPGGNVNLSANLSIAIPKATSLVDGYLAAADFGNFLSGSPRSTLVTQATGTLTLTAGSPPLNRIMIGTQITTPGLTIVLPAANLYGSAAGYPYLEFVDIVGGVGGSATANFGITLIPTGSDLIDNTGSVALPQGIGYLRVSSNGSNRWTTTKYYVDSFKDGTNPTKTVTLDVSKQVSGQAGVLTLATGASVTVGPTDITPQPGFVTEITSTGSVLKSTLTPTDLVPREYTVGTSGVDIPSGTVFNVPNISGSEPDTVRIAGRLGGPISLRWPNANIYSLSESVVLLDASGSVTSTNSVAVSNVNGHTFNGLNSFIFDEPNGRKVLTSDNATNWAVSLVKTSIQPFRQVSPVNGDFILTLDANAVKQNFHLLLGNGQNTLSFLGATDGMEIDLIAIQPASGTAGTLFLPIGSYVSGGGLGLVSLTATNGAIDRVKGVFDGILNAFLWQAAILNHTSAALPAAPSALGSSGVTSHSVILSWTDNATNETGFKVERAVGASQTTGFQVVASTGANVLSYTDNGLTAGATYTYRVRAFNAGGFSAYSSSINVTASAGGPTAELWEVHFNDNAGTVATATVGPNAILNYADWTTSTQSGSGAALNVTPGMLATTGTSVTPTGGVAGTATWVYRVLAFKGTLHNTSPTISTGNTGYNVLSATAYNHIVWSAVTGADSYRIYRITATNGTPSTTGLIATGVSSAATSFDDTGFPQIGTIPGDIANPTDAHTATAITPITYGVNQMVLSVTFWIKGLFSATGTITIVSANQSTANWRINQITSGGAKLQIVFPGASGSATFTVPNTINNNAWHHVAITMDNSTAVATAADVKVYYDGSSTAQTTTMGTNTKSGAFAFPASSPVVGDSAGTYVIDDVRIYNRIITSTPVTGDIALLFAGQAQ